MKSLFIPMLTLSALVLLPALAADQAQTAMQDQKFFNAAMQSGQDEVALGQLAKKHATTAEVKQLSDTLVNDHAKVNAQLKDLAAKNNWQFTPTAAEGQWDALMKAQGKDFDRQFVAKVIDEHQKAIALFEQQSQSGSNPELKQLATNTLPHLRHHLEMARELDQKLASGQPSSDRSIDVRHEQLKKDQKSMDRRMEPKSGQPSSSQY